MQYEHTFPVPPPLAAAAAALVRGVLTHFFYVLTRQPVGSPSGSGVGTILIIAEFTAIVRLFAPVHVLHPTKKEASLLVPHPGCPMRRDESEASHPCVPTCSQLLVSQGVPAPGSSCHKILAYTPRCLGMPAALLA